MRKHEVIRHGVDFLLLVVIIGMGLGGMYYFRYYGSAAQIADAILMAIFYIFWGMYHHYHDGDLTNKVILEYTSVAALATFILIIFLLRA